MESNQTQHLDLTQFAQKVDTIMQQIGTVVVGQQDAIYLILAAILADGHVLLEGVPGVAKTLLARLISRLIDARFSRLQFTPDLMPSDVLGTTVFNARTAEFDFHAGPVFTDILLVDEVNRAPAKTQAALFEVMEERQVTIDSVTHPMGRLYTVLATQNPVEQEGTYRLPEAQLDRFMIKVVMGYPTLEQEVEILQRHHADSAFTHLDQVKPVLSIDELLEMRTLLNKVVVDASLYRYIAQLVQNSRTSHTVALGASPRAAVAMLRIAVALALLQGRDYLTPDDVKTVAPAVLQHRIIPTAEAEMQGFTPTSIINRLLEQTEVGI